jgi:hypothetical protein
MYTFGNWMTRALRGGVTLSPAEQWLLDRLVRALPDDLRDITHAQLVSYNLAQREVDGRAVNFYRRPALLPNMPLLPMSVGEAPLVRLSTSTGSGDPVHATLNAVSGRVFCIAFSRAIGALSPSDLAVAKVTEAWRSNFPASGLTLRSSRNWIATPSTWQVQLAMLPATRSNSA